MPPSQLIPENKSLIYTCFSFYFVCFSAPCISLRSISKSRLFAIYISSAWLMDYSTLQGRLSR
ncbi:hypothetical protein BJX68DRAFT_224619 [Aspergillus pseudodeflectus]|uniref:Uncharacterized protein n=1 Tax=Aspergillus pseudodeflectus TaxID=176178 RepID=A0ABR4L769_9EURO